MIERYKKFQGGRANFTSDKKREESSNIELNQKVEKMEKY